MDDKVNILVVDDLPEKLLVYRTVLEELGQNIITAQSGGDALKKILQHEFAVILLDVNMPSMDGFETAALIRRRKKSAHTPILFVTAYVDELRLVQGYAHGAVDYILSPVAPEVLRAKVKVFVDLYRLNQQLKRQAQESVALAEERAKRAAAEEAGRASAFLAEAGAVLGNSLDLATMLRGLATHAVPFLADFCLVSVTAGPSLGERIEWCWAADDLKSTPGRALQPPELPDWLRQALDKVLASGRSEHLSQVQTTSGWDATLKAALILPLSARGRTLGVLALASGPATGDFTANKLSLASDLASRAGIAIDNALLVQNIQEADRRKDEFLAMLAHELRNPLAPICNAAHLMRIIGPADPRLDSVRDMVDRQLKHMTRLVDDLLDVSRITTGKIRLQVEVFDASAAVAAAVETARPQFEARKQNFSVALPEKAIPLHGDQARISQVLANLLNNAAKYTPEGGNIALTLEREGDQAIFRVKDDGVGIATDMLSHVFELFTQADRSLDRAQGGLGIGLTLVHRLVEIHHGSVQAVSKGLGHGSEFIVRLPILGEQTSPAPTTNGAAPSKPDQRKMRVLIVDDNVDAADSLGMVIRLEGHEVRTAYEGAGALEVFSAFRPEVIFLDIGLPHMDGYEVARRLRQQANGDKVLLAAVTGYGSETDRRRSLQAGFDYHLVKPVGLDDVRRLLTSSARKATAV